MLTLQMANAVFTTKPEPSYDDLPELRYHFPARYLRQAEQALNDWIVYYEPRREGGVSSRATGRQCYFATARVTRIERDPDRDDHYYAYVSDYLEFTNPVPFREGATFYESRLRKPDGSTNKGRFGWSLRVIPANEYRMICQIGFSEAISAPGVSGSPSTLAEEPVPYGRSNRTVLLERPFRDAAFTRVLRSAYESTCAMTGLKLINGGGRCEIEAAHIRPVEKDGPDSPRNGVALSRTVHWMFDRGILSIGDKGEILMAKRLVPDQVRRMLNPAGRVNLPTAAGLTPHPVFMRYHREFIFKGE
jgi:putative restriction endonuclease